MCDNIVIIGNGIAGLNCAEQLRKLNSTCNITLIGNEPYLTYSRPMISKAPLIGFDINNFLVHTNEWYTQNNINIILNTNVLKINEYEKTVLFENEQVLPYDKCVLATGAASFRPPLPGADKKGVFVVRTNEDISNIRTYCLNAKTAVVIGGGVIGLEIAYELHNRGLVVSIVEREQYLMERLLDRESSLVLQAIIESQGVKVFTGVETKCLNASEYVDSVSLSNSTTLPADIVILCCGIKANTKLAADANIETERSIVVNSKMQTSSKDIYACGDCAQFNNINLGLWGQCIAQSTVVAHNICEIDKEYSQIEPCVIFNCFKTSLAAVGDIGKNKNKSYTEIVYKNRIKHSLFKINKQKENLHTYEKYYFANGVIVGGVLLGDLSSISILENAIKEKKTQAEFIKLLDNNI